MEERLMWDEEFYSSRSFKAKKCQRFANYENSSSHKRHNTPKPKHKAPLVDDFVLTQIMYKWDLSIFKFLVCRMAMEHGVKFNSEETSRGFRSSKRNNKVQNQDVKTNKEPVQGTSTITIDGNKKKKCGISTEGLIISE